jgi:hypothetical protein|tara:strand:- start:7 stop:297 length:291 start_codon:yes stop_codon:yes gene_type:complete
VNIREKLVEYWGDEELLFLDPPEDFDYAIVGIAERINMEPVVVYDRSKILKQLQKEMPPVSAVEYFEFNILGSYVGEKTPIFINFVENKRGSNGSF